MNMVLVEPSQIVMVSQRIDEILGVLDPRISSKPVRNFTTFSQISDALDYLEMLAKYERFDVEASHREVEGMKRLLRHTDDGGKNHGEGKDG